MGQQVVCVCYMKNYGAGLIIHKAGDSWVSTAEDHEGGVQVLGGCYGKGKGEKLFSIYIFLPRMDFKQMRSTIC